MVESNVLDYDLVKQFIEGDQKSIEILIKRHKRKVYTYILLIVKNHELAEDIFQDTFIKVIKSLKQNKYTDDGKFVSWVIRIAHNLIIDYFRKEKNLKTVSNDNTDLDIFNSYKFSEPTIESKMVKEQVFKDIRNLIEKLPYDQREVIVLRHYIGLSFKEIAEETNVSINTALGRMRYALINLRKMIKDNKMSLSFN